MWLEEFNVTLQVMSHMGREVECFRLKSFHENTMVHTLSSFCILCPMGVRRENDWAVVLHYVAWFSEAHGV